MGLAAVAGSIFTATPYVTQNGMLAVKARGPAMQGPSSPTKGAVGLGRRLRRMAPFRLRLLAKRLLVRGNRYGC